MGRLSAPSGATLIDLGPLELADLVEHLVTAGARSSDVDEAVFDADPQEWRRIYDPDGKFDRVLSDRETIGPQVTFPQWIMWWRLSPDEMRRVPAWQKRIGNAVIFVGLAAAFLVLATFLVAGCHGDPGCPIPPR